MRRFSKSTAALISGSVSLVVASSLSLAAQVPATGLYIEPRVFNDFPNSTETYNINTNPTVTNPTGNFGVSGLPASVAINDTNMVNASGTGFANRDDVLISSNNGASPTTLDINTGFTISANITLSFGIKDPRKEAGIRIEAPVTGDALFIVNSDGEIVAFGGGAPFYNFRPAIEANYSSGQTIFLREQYVPGVGGTTGANPGTLEYSAQLAGGPLFDSGPLAFSNNEGGPTNYQIGFYDQAPQGATTASDFINARFNNINASVPEPTTLSLLALGGVTLLSRRRATQSA